MVDATSYGTPWTVEVEGFEKVEVALHQNEVVMSYKAWQNPLITETNWVIEGFLKWDGCLEFMTNPNSYYHLCEPERLLAISTLFNKVGDEAVAHMPGYEGGFHTP